MLKTQNTVFCIYLKNVSIFASPPEVEACSAEAQHTINKVAAIRALTLFF